MTLGKIATIATISAAVMAGSVTGAIGAIAGSGRHADAAQKEVPQPAISSPALTSEDVAGLRTDMRELRASINDLNTRLSRVEGRNEVRR